MRRRGRVLAGADSRLKQVCNHPAHFLRDGSRARRAAPASSTRVEELLEEILAAGDKVLCFTQFAEWGDLLRPHLERRFGCEAAVAARRRPPQPRDEMVDRFQQTGRAADLPASR